jgi:hypothetical protein
MKHDKEVQLKKNKPELKIYEEMLAMTITPSSGISK